MEKYGTDLVFFDPALVFGEAILLLLSKPSAGPATKETRLVFSSVGLEKSNPASFFSSPSLLILTRPPMAQRRMSAWPVVVLFL